MSSVVWRRYQEKSEGLAKIFLLDIGLLIGLVFLLIGLPKKNS